MKVISADNLKNMKKVWKDIQGYEGFYQVSNFGDVRSLNRITCHGHKRKGIVLKHTVNKDGYLLIQLNKDGQSTFHMVHRLVAFEFVPNSEDKPDVNHLDGNKLNNCVSNLRWADRSESLYHSYEIGLNKGNRMNKQVKLTNLETGEVMIFISQNDISRYLGFNKNWLRLRIRNRNDNIFRYKKYLIELLG